MKCERQLDFPGIKHKSLDNKQGNFYDIVASWMSLHCYFLGGALRSAKSRGKVEAVSAEFKMCSWCLAAFKYIF